MKLWKILAHPIQYFRSLPSDQEGISGPLAFALVTHWLGAYFTFLWQAMIGGSMSRFFQNLLTRATDSIQFYNPGQTTEILQLRDQIINWCFSVGPIIMDPFKTLFTLLFTAIFVYVAARIFVPQERKVTYQSAVHIVAFGTAPAILGIFPLAGHFVVPFYTGIVTILGAREVYRISNFRAVIVALFPKLLVLFMIVFGFLFFAVTIFQFFFSFF